LTQGQVALVDPEEYEQLFINATKILDKEKEILC
jgi:translation elongation factor P/translation initiation factor 5A